MEQIWNDIVNFVNINGFKIITLILTIVLGILLIKLLNRWIKRILTRKKVDGIVANFISSILYVVLVVLLIISLFDILEISTTPFVTVLGTIGLALALSLKDSLSNIASGLIMIATKPFKQEDYVNIGGLEGSVKKINLFTTELATFDNKKIVLSNNKVAKSDIINYSSLDTRRLDINFTAPFGTSVDKVKDIFNQIFAETKNILQSPPPNVKLLSHTQSMLTFSARMWVSNDSYWDVYFDMQEKMYKVLNEEQIEIKENKIDVNIISK